MFESSSFDDDIITLPLTIFAFCFTTTKAATRSCFDNVEEKNDKGYFMMLN